MDGRIDPATGVENANTPTPFWQGLDKAESGIFIEGTISARVRERMKMGDETVEKIKYRVATNGPDVYVDDIRPPGYLSIGTYVKIPIFIRPWARKNGQPSFSCSVARPHADRGETF